MFYELFQLTLAPIRMNPTNLKMWILLISAVFVSQTLSASTSEEVIKPFPDASLSSWKEKSFVGNTTYDLVEVQSGVSVLKASANETASVLYKEMVIDLTDTPWLEWSWKVESIYENINEKARDGDDYPARLYVTAQIGFLPWDSIAINYVWSSNQPINSAWQSPFTDKSMLVSVQSGKSQLGNWVSQRRNIVDDFKQLFGVDVKKISGYAVMVDGDNSSQTGTAFFGNIDFLTK